MSDTQSKQQSGNNYNHRKILDLVLDLNLCSFSDHNANANQTNLPK